VASDIYFGDPGYVRANVADRDRHVAALGYAVAAAAALDIEMAI
jgi:hypothetical protein